MISSATMKLGKKTLKLKFTTRALIRLETENGGASFDELLDKLITGKGGVTLVASALAAGLNDGKGIDQEQALDLIDQAGGFRKLMPLIGEAIGVAFPMRTEVEETGEAGEADAGKAEAPAEA